MTDRRIYNVHLKILVKRLTEKKVKEIGVVKIEMAETVTEKLGFRESDNLKEREERSYSLGDWH